MGCPTSKVKAGTSLRGGGGGGGDRAVTLHLLQDTDTHFHMLSATLNSELLLHPFSDTHTHISKYTWYCTCILLSIKKKIPAGLEENNHKQNRKM